jgi:hypothetical protein
VPNFALQIIERVEKYMKFARENDLRRRRAIKKFQKEFCEREEKVIEFNSLENLFRGLLQRCEDEILYSLIL